MGQTLYYIHDPMCSWCWAFRPVLTQLLERLPDDIHVQKLLGGLAPDTEEPMPVPMRERLQQTWHLIEQEVPGTRFNFDFWEQNLPRRATYPACRAVLAANEQGGAEEMLAAIQTAYYRQARNPSDTDTLLELASELGFDRHAFEQALGSLRIQQQLEGEIEQARALGADSYPSLILVLNGEPWPVPIDYNEVTPMLSHIDWLREEALPD